MKQWLEPEPDIIFSSEYLAACGDDPLIAAILWRRGYHDPDSVRGYLSPNVYPPCPPEALPDLVTASELIAAMREKKVLVWGDFDVDGQTATALLVDGLTRLGIDVAYYVPNRQTESHGIRVHSLEAQIALHKPDLIITCDTGVNEFEAIAWLNRRVKLIITDHHDLSDHLPPADAVVTPRRLPDDHPLASLPGVGVAYKLMQYLYTHLDRAAELPRLLDLVSLGIVSDVAVQTFDTRYLLQIGLDRLRHTTRPGLEALMEVAKVDPLSMNAEQIGFQIGPRLNAAGRLGDARLAIELLTTRDRARARLLAEQLDGYNQQRRLLTQEMESEAAELIAATPALLEGTVLVLHQANWHPGILGIVAARLAERYDRPVILLTDGEGGLVRGSARSVPGYDISAMIAAQAALLDHFGGHPGAAGVSLRRENLEPFRAQVASSPLPESIPAPRLTIDAIVTLGEITPEFAGRLSQLAPFGEGNPAPLLETRALTLEHHALAGRSQQHRRLSVRDASGAQHIVLWWGGAIHPLPRGTFDLVYNIALEPNRDVLMTLTDVHEHPETIPETTRAPIDVHDHRDRHLSVEEALKLVLGAQVWGEAYNRAQYPDVRRRSDLVPGEALIIYTIPSDPAALRRVLDTVDPKIVYVIGIEPPLRGSELFLERLRLAAQNVIDHRNGETPIEVLCGATAGSVRCVHAGLEVHVADGAFGEIVWLRQGLVRIVAGHGQGDPSARTRFDTAYREMVAYRRYFAGAPIDRLIEG
jgi:single-stranded-DNA-specific exonuclease